MSELLNIQLLLDSKEHFAHATWPLQSLIPDSVSWSGAIRDACTIDVRSGKDEHLGLRPWTLHDFIGLPKDVLLCLQVAPKVHLQQSLILTNREEHIEMGVSFDLGSALQLPLHQLEMWLIEQVKHLIPLGAFALLAGPELFLKWGDTSESLVNSALNDYSNALWAIVARSACFDSQRFEVVSEPLPSHQLLRKKDISRMYPQWAS